MPQSYPSEGDCSLVSEAVAVVGAGIVGCATAHELARRGVPVALLDRGEVAGGASGLDEAGALCSSREPGPMLSLAPPALRLYGELEQLLGREAGIRRTGALVAYLEDAGWRAEPARLERMRAAGVECELVAGERVRELEPALGAGVLGASLFPGDLRCAPRAIARGLAREAERLGARVRAGVEVDSIGVRGGRVVGVETAAGPLAADVVVLAAGAWSAPLARGAGLELPLEPRRGQLLRLWGPPGLPRRQLVEGAYPAAAASGDPGLRVAGAIAPARDGGLIVGSSRERRGFEMAADPAVGEAILARAARLVPAVRDLAVESAWTGLRPWLPDGLPAIGPTGAAEGLWVATGHEGAGALLGPLTGRLVARGICGEPRDADLAPCDPDRF